MSDLLDDLDLAPERAPVKEPAKAWDNWWRIVAPVGFPIGTEFRMGPHPSKDVAETCARAERNALFSIIGATDDSFFEYLGAFPEGERP